MSFTITKVATPNGRIAVRDSGGLGVPIIMVHGASASGAVFANQFESALVDHFRLIAIDLPGHGKSDNFTDPHTSYTLPAVATVVADVIAELGIARAIVMGWSLGGHIAIELMASHPHLLCGVMASGTPPIDCSPISQLRAFHISRAVLSISKRTLSPREAERFAKLCFGAQAAPDHVAEILRADGDMRVRMTRSIMRGDGANQRHTVETSRVPLAMVNGSQDPAIRTSYVAGLDYANLWEGQCHLIAGCGHAPFLCAPNRFNTLLHRFATKVSLSVSTPAAPPIARRA